MQGEFVSDRKKLRVGEGVVSQTGSPPPNDGRRERASIRNYIEVLRPLTVWAQGRRLRLGPPSQRAVLAILALSPNVAFHRDAIFEVLWGSESPRCAVGTLHTYVSRLRSILDLGGGLRGNALCREGNSYLLRVDRGQLDLLDFRDRVAQAQKARAAGSSVAAATLYGHALQLWNGQPVADIDILQSHPSVIGLAQERLSVIASYAEAACDAGLHDEVLPCLWSTCATEPLNERMHACLMIALAGSGMAAKAIIVFEELRQRLDDQLGLLPGPELADAHSRVLHQNVPSAILCCDHSAYVQDRQGVRR
jgi:DNA-binding SARP family transcriptional activator